MLVTLFGIVIEVKPVQPENALPPMLVTLLGIVTEVKAVQSENVQSPMLVTPLGIVTEVKAVQPEKAQSPMLVTPLGIVTEVAVRSIRDLRKSLRHSAAPSSVAISSSDIAPVPSGAAISRIAFASAVS